MFRCSHGLLEYKDENLAIYGKSLKELVFILKYPDNKTEYLNSVFARHPSLFVYYPQKRLFIFAQISTSSRIWELGIDCSRVGCNCLSEARVI